MMVADTEEGRDAMSVLEPFAKPPVLQALPGQDRTSISFAINSHDEVVGLNGDNPDVATIWLHGDQAQVMLPRPSGWFVGINDDTIAVGLLQDPAQAVVWAPRRGPESLPLPEIIIPAGTLGSLRGVLSVASDINNHGVICGADTDHIGAVHNLWTGDTTVVPPPPGPVPSQLVGINDEDPFTAVGFWWTDTGARAYAWRDGRHWDLGDVYSIAAVNRWGVVVGTASVDAPAMYAPVSWDLDDDPVQRRNVPLPPLPGALYPFDGGQAFGVNDSGAIVGSCWNALGGPNDKHAFVYDGTASTNLADVGFRLGGAYSAWTLRTATAINNHGVLTGQARTPYNTEQAYLLAPGWRTSDTFHPFIDTADPRMQAAGQWMTRNPLRP
jgi:hypothetical protein